MVEEDATDKDMVVGEGLDADATDKDVDQKCKNLRVSYEKALNLEKDTFLPHLKEIGTNTLLDIMEGKNAKQALRSNFATARNNFVRQQRRRHPR